ncbi:MAG TPA: XdhC family protein [Polyangiaceae bacterium]|nr:XdhC family protein [Polyangiaceae bacterium]
MSDLHAITQTLRRLRAEQIRYLVATVMQVSGSSYRRPGARMIMGEDGSVTGGISAGCLEAALIRTAWWRTRNQEAVLVKYDSTSDDDELGWGSGFGCNGVVEVLVEREHAASDAALDFITHTVAREQRGCLLTVFRSSAARVPVGSRASMTAAGDLAFYGRGEWGDFIEADELAAVRQVAKTGSGRTLILQSHEGQIDVLVEPVVPPPRLFLCGEGPDAVPLARFARDLGWSVVVWASEPRWLSRERFHGLGELATGTAHELRREVDASAQPAAVILSHRYERDRDLLEGLLASKTTYIGILGPRARALRLLADVGQPTLSADVARRIHAPIGLDIGAETPQEIGLSVMAEIQAVLSGSTAKPLSQCRGQIHRPRLAALETAVGAE